MNFNFGGQNDYRLNSSMVEEVINMYGVKIKLVLQERVNNDQVVFGDYSHLFSDGEHQHEMFQLPENTEEFDNLDISFSQFGLSDMTSINLFIHRNSIENIPGVEPINSNSRDYAQKMKPTVQDLDFHLVGHLVVLPSGKIYEITDQRFSVPGVNNLFTSKNDKTVYKVTCVQYQPKLINELDQMDISTFGSSEEEVESYVPDLSLEDYFEELNQAHTDQEFEAEVNDTQEKIINTDIGTKKISTSIIDTTEKSPWD